MKIALLGKGKTGSKVLELAQGHEVEVFDSSNLPTYEKLIKHQVIVSFLPGEAFQALIPVLLETKLPVVTGSTGFTWPSHFDQTLQEKSISWIFGTNFSLGVVVLKQLIERLHHGGWTSFKEKTYFQSTKFITLKNSNAPSGTALSMKEWLKETL